MANWDGLIIALMIILNGYFVACEIVLISARKTKIDEYIKKGKRRAKLVKIAIEKLATFLPVTQVGVTLTSIALGIIAAPILENFLKTHIPQYIVDFIIIDSRFSLLPYISFLLITYFQLSFGELIPKTIAMRNPERYSLLIIPPLFLFNFLFMPLTAIVNFTTNGLLSLFGIKSIFKERPYSEEEIKMILSSSGRDGVISEMEKEMTSNIFQLKKLRIRNIMIPRKKIIGFDSNETISTIRDKIIQNKLSFNNYPIYKENLHNIIGYIHISDILGGTNLDDKNQLITASALKRILYFNQRENTDIILISMKRQMINAAIILDDKRRTVGFVTISDIIEQVVKNS